MALTALTDLSIRKLTARPDERVEVFDSKLPGFGLRIFPSGVKSFVVFYRHQGVLRRVTLGRYPVLSLTEARRKALAVLSKNSLGEDPKPKKPDPLSERHFDLMVEEFVQRHCAQRNRPRTARETERILRVTFVGAWGDRDMRAIEKSDVNTVLDALVARGNPSTANHALAAIRKFYNWCVARDYIAISPCAGISSPGMTTSRDRILSDDELRSIWLRADGSGFPYEVIIKLLVLTGQRRGEVTGMCWGEIDLAARVWSIPAERTKSNRAQILPLSSVAVSVLLDTPRLSDKLVFPALGRDAGSFSGFSKAKRRLDDASGVAEWTLHDIRRTVATGLARLGVAPHVVERILNHTSYSLGGVAGIYNRFGYLPEMRMALDLWSIHVSSLVVTRADDTSQQSKG